MKKLISVVTLLVLLSSTLFAKWALVPLDELVADSDLIVIGTLHSAEEDSEGVGMGYILVDSIIKTGAKTLDDRPMKAGDDLKLTWEDSWACASGMHLRWRNQKGIWLLKIQEDGTVTAGYPGRFRSIEDLDQIRQLSNRKKVTNSMTVDVSADSASLEVFSVKLTDQITPRDVSAFPEYSFLRALIVLLLSMGLYRILYKSRFRIR